MTKDELIKVIQKLHSETGETPELKNWKELTNISPHQIRVNFDSYASFVLEAGLPWHTHTLNDKTEEGTANCIVCGPVKTIPKKNYSKKTKGTHPITYYCPNSNQARKFDGRLAKLQKVRIGYRKYKKDYCENPDCTATIVCLAQLDVHHIDHNKKNNDPSNLKTLCANCHRAHHHGYLD